MKKDQQIADVCLIIEGTSPYGAGELSVWIQELLQAQSHLTFHMVCLVSPDGKEEVNYRLPSNVLGISYVTLQKLPKGTRLDSKANSDLFQALELPLLSLQHKACLKLLGKVINALKEPEVPLGSEVLLESREAWGMLERMYRQTMSENSFLNYFWTWRGTLSGFYSVLLAELPAARIYHALGTGYAGLYLARAHLETECPALITEHGIYTNERRIEMTAANWLNDTKEGRFRPAKPRYERDLKDFWIDSFAGYSKLAYEASTKIISMYEGNQELQVLDGADRSKMCIVPDGIEISKFSIIERMLHDRPTIALIGSVVPLKDVKTYIRACYLLKAKIPNLHAYVLGATEADVDYYQECVRLVKQLDLQDTLTFTGRVKVTHYLSNTDVAVFTSISEAQPISLLEAGAAGIPIVATDVGACREIIFGQTDERPSLGQGGYVVSLTNPEQVAEAVYRLLMDKPFYIHCSAVIKKRIESYYQSSRQKNTYREIYDDLLQHSAVEV